MKEAEARTIAVELAARIGLPIRRGTVLVHAADSGYQLLVSADVGWLQGHDLPPSFKGLPVYPTDRIIGTPYLKMKIHA
jgi:hypothetical protein